jgi:hypothetical protein
MITRQLHGRSACPWVSSRHSEYLPRRPIRTRTPAVRACDGLSQTDKKQWEDCKCRLQDLGVCDLEEAERILEESFGWSGQSFWNGEKVRHL